MDAHSLTTADVDIREGLLERQVELLLAGEALDRAAAGNGTMLTIEGPIGSGRSSLGAAVAAEASERDFDVAVAAGREFEREFGFGVVLQLLESRVADSSEQEREALFSGPAGQALELFGPGPRPGFGDPSFPLLHGLYWLCINLTKRTPLLLWVDDADLADTESLRFMLYLAERVESLPLVLAVAFGRESLSSDEEFARVAEHPGAVRCSVGPFSPEASASRLRGCWYPGAPATVCDAVHASTQGNPWLVDELGAALQSLSQDPRVAEERIAELCPPAIAVRALARARRLGPDAPALLRAAAVFGPGAELRNAVRLAGLESDQAGVAVDALIEAGLLVPEPRLTYAHPIVETAIRAALPVSARAAAHLKAARLLDEEDASPERVAQLLLGATRTGSGWAVDKAVAASGLALARGAPDEALLYLRRALDEPPPPGRRAHVMLELGRAEAAVGDPRASMHLREALERVAEGPERAETGLKTARTLLALGRAADAADALERGALNAEGELAERLEVAQLTLTRLFGRAAGDTPVLVPEQRDTPAARARLALAAFDSAIRGEPHEQARELAEAALANGRLLDEETSDGISYYLASISLVLTEDLSTAEAALTAAVEDAHSRGSLLGFASASYARSLAILARGRVVDAAADAGRAIDVERHGWRMATASARAVMATSLLEQGDLAGAGRHLAAAELMSDRDEATRVTWLATRGRLRLLKGEADAALTDFLRSGELLERWGSSNPALLPWRQGAAAACAALGDWSEARRLAERDVALAEAFGAPGALGRALRSLAAVRNDDGKLETLRAAVETFERSQTALERAYALVDFGAALRRAGYRRDAREPLRRGADLAARCGAVTLMGRAVREAKVAGARPRRTALEGVESLTARERQVANLAAQGLSNREIAELLVVTLKTVEWHLRHTYRKLGLSSRRKLRDALGAVED